MAGSDLPANIAYYPYSASNEIAKSGSAYAITVDLPSTQNYVEYSFGNGAFPMAAVTSNESDYNLKFKNALGGLKLQLKGTARISRITVMGNNGETLCGTATLNVSNATTPSIALTDATKTLVTLDCGEGVQLNTETATTFVIALPPITMTGGFTVDIYDTGSGTQQIKSTRSQTITRSALLAMPEISI
ncbi:MAG: fimbrillin family protein [Lachnospiraceae bacterium]|nr:fimbrillin family protein [Lachnospiraceae bacterium]